MKTVKRDLIATCVRSCVAMVALCLGALHAGAAINITSNTQLSGDTDYRGQGVVTIAVDVTLDLNGYKLYVDGLAGAGRIIDSKCYEILEYVQATGKQCVPTDYTPGTDTKLEVDFAPKANVPNATLYGTTTFSHYSFLCMVNAGKFYFFGDGHNLPVDDDTRYRSFIGGGTFSLVRQADGVEIGFYAENQTNTGDGNLTFFSTPKTADRNGYGKLYGVRAWHGDELRLDLLPVRRADTGEVGLFNRVNGAFFVNTTTTPLVAGAATGATLSSGSLLVTAADASSLSGFTGTVDPQVRTIFDGAFAFSFVFGNTQLQADADYRGKGPVTIAAGATLDLNGHKLLVDGLVGAGRMTDSKCYEILDYVQSNGKQCVRTDYKPGPYTTLEVDFSPVTNVNQYTLYGTTRFTANMFLCMINKNKFYFFGSGSTNLPVDDGVRYSSIVRNGYVSLIRRADCAEIGSFVEGQSNVDNGNLVFFDSPSSANRAGHYKVHGARVWHAKELRLDLVPVRRADTGELGLFNRVNGVLFGNTTTTSLAAGAATGATLGVGSLRVAATDGSSLSAFAGTVDPQVRTFVDGDFSLSDEADWRAFGKCAIDGNIDLGGHDLRVATLGGLGSVTDSGSAYDRLEYVVCDGRQRVLTGVVPGPKTALELELVFTPESDLKTCTVFGCSAWTSYRCLMFLEKKNLYYFGKGTIICQPAKDTRYRVNVTPTESTNGTVTVTDVSTGRQVASKTESLANEDKSELVLFGRTANLANLGSFRLCSFKIFEDGEVVRNFTPVRHVKTGVVGFLDSVTGKFFTSNTGTGLLAGPTVAAAERTGCLRVDVPKDVSCANAGLSLKGALTLVKEGEGTLTVLKENQTYLGGTEILGGELDVEMGCGTKQFLADYGYLGPTYKYDEEARSRILVTSNTVFDFKGNYDFRLYGITLAGGTLRNGGHAQSPTGGSFGTIPLTDDSRLEAIRDITFYDSRQLKLELGGHTLVADTCDSRIYFRNGLQITNGTLSAVGNGDLYFYSAVEARTAELRVACPLFVNAAVDVRDYYAACTTNVNGGTAAMNVYGRFTPETDYFYGCTLQDGSVLDLDAREGVWPTVSAFTNGLNRVTFAEGATVTIDAHVRKRWSGKVVDWGEGNRPVNVTFRMSPESRLLGRRLRVCPDGLYAVAGLNIIVR